MPPAVTGRECPAETLLCLYLDLSIGLAPFAWPINAQGDGTALCVCVCRCVC